MLGRTDEAIAAWREVLAIDPSDLRALTALEGLFERDGRRDESLDMLEKRAVLLEDDDERRATLLKAAAGWDELGDREPRGCSTSACAPRIRTTWSRPSGSRRSTGTGTSGPRSSRSCSSGRSSSTAVHQQVQLLHEVAESTSASSEIRRVRSTCCRPRSTAITVTSRRARSSSGSPRTRTCGTSCATTSQLGRHSAPPPSARSRRISRCSCTIRLRPTRSPRSTDSIVRPRRGSRSPTSWRAARGSRSTTRDLVDLQLELGSVLDQHLGDTGQAIVAYQKVLDVEPENLVALRALEALYEKTSQYDKYLAVLEASSGSRAGDGERISLYERIASTYEERFGDLRRAADAYEQIIEIDARNYAAYHLLARLYQQLGNHEALVETHRKHIAATTDVPTRIELYVAMGQVYATKLRDLDRAIEAYNDALALDPSEPHALEALADLYEQLGEWDHAIDMLGRVVQAQRRHAQARAVLAHGPHPVQGARRSPALPRRACCAGSRSPPTTCRRWRR